MSVQCEVIFSLRAVYGKLAHYHKDAGLSEAREERTGRNPAQLPTK
jgi:hypothetical protein